MTEETTPTVDENGNPITTEVVEEPETEEQKDYATLYEQEKLRADKYEWRFKKTAKELNEIKKDNPAGNVAEQVSKQVAEEMFYANNPVAKEYQKEIREIQAKSNLSSEDAMTFYIAKNKPELIWTKIQTTWVDWVAQPITPTKDYKDMTYEELWDKNLAKK